MRLINALRAARCNSQGHRPVSALRRASTRTTTLVEWDTTAPAVQNTPLVPATLASPPTTKTETKLPQSRKTKRPKSAPFSYEWSEFNDLLFRRSSTLAALINSIPADVSLGDLSRSKILSMLQHPSDIPTLIDFIPFVAQHISLSPPERCTPLIHGLLRNLESKRMLAVVPEVISLFLNCMERLVEDAWNADDLNRAYKAVFNALGTIFDHSDRSSDRLPVLHKVAHDQVYRVLLHLVEMVGRLPSSSTSPPSIDMTVIKRLFGSRFLTPRLRDVLLRHCETHKLQLTASMWKRCFLVTAAAGGDCELADEFARRHARQQKEELRIGADASNGVESLATDDERMDVSSRNPTAGRFANASPRPLKSNSRREKKSPELIAAIEEILLAQRDGSLDSVIAALEPYLHLTSLDDTGPDSLQAYAWSAIFDRIHKDTSVSLVMLDELYERIPKLARTGPVLTQVMTAMISRGRPEKAWQIWRELVASEKDAWEPMCGKYVDEVTVAVACQAVANVDAAVALLDAWARRPGHGSGLGPRRSVPSWDRHLNEESPRSLSLDTQNLNILLNRCKLEGRVGIAFRLWIAARSRWGIYPDDISLTLLIDAARFADETSVERPSIGKRLKELADELRRRRRSETEADGSEGDDGSFEAYDAAGFAKGSSTVLLDPADYSWRRENGQAPWGKARALFRRIMLSNYPWLAGIKSCLDFEKGQYAGQAGFMRGFRDFIGSRPIGTTLNPQQIEIDGAKRGRKKTIEPYSIRLPSRNAHYTFCIPSAETFQSYIGLLGFFDLSQEIPIALGWMKELGIKPTWKSMNLALTYMSQNEGPRRMLSAWDQSGGARLVSDEDVLRRWLREWLEPEAVFDAEDIDDLKSDESDEFERRYAGGPSSIVPKEGDVAAYIREIGEKRLRREHAERLSTYEKR